MSAKRISADQARRDIFNLGALLVCAYDDTSKFEQYRLQQAISLEELKKVENQLREEEELIFYCA